MTETKATVDVITAEVRVLSVGSRQVTLSVYNQLDIVKPLEIDPFGRVAPKDGKPSIVWVVGKHTKTGALVRSYLPTTKDRMDEYMCNALRPVEEAQKQVNLWAVDAKTARDNAKRLREQAAEKTRDDGWQTIGNYETQAAECDAAAATAATELERLRHVAEATHKRAKAAVLRAEVESLEAEAAEHDQKADHADKEHRGWVNIASQRQDVYDQQWNAKHELSDRWSQLPLIVLAGLRLSVPAG